MNNCNHTIYQGRSYDCIVTVDRPVYHSVNLQSDIPDHRTMLRRVALSGWVARAALSASISASVQRKPDRSRRAGLYRSWRESQELSAAGDMPSN